MLAKELQLNLIDNYNYNYITNTAWNTRYKDTTGRMEVHNNPVALT